MSKFYVVERAGVPNVWESDPEHINVLLKRHSGFAIASAAPSETRQGALVVLRQFFPGQRPLRPKAK